MRECVCVTRSRVAVEPKQVCEVVLAPGEEAIPEARVRELAVLLRDFVGAGRVVRPAPAAVLEEVHSRHSCDGAVAPKKPATPEESSVKEDQRENNRWEG